jgi:hypothetical protein
VLVFWGVIPTNTKLTHVFGSIVLVLVLVYYKLTLTPPSKHGHYFLLKNSGDNELQWLHEDMTSNVFDHQFIRKTEVLIMADSLWKIKVSFAIK